MLALIIIAIVIGGLVALVDLIGLISEPKEDALIFGPNFIALSFAIIVLSLLLAKGGY